MADEQAQEEVETSQEEQPSEETSTGSEAEIKEEEPKNTEATTDKGDLSVALKQEREKRQTIERQLNDPNFAYELAKKHGLTEEQASGNGTPPPINTYDQVNEILAYKEAVKEFPKAETDPDIANMVDGLVGKGYKPADAVKVVQKRFSDAMEEAKTEGVKQKENEDKTQKQAQTAEPSPNISFDAEEQETLIKQSKDYLHPQVQKEAMLKLIKKQHKLK